VVYIHVEYNAYGDTCYYKKYFIEQEVLCPIDTNACPVPDNFTLRPGDAFVTCYSEGNPLLPVAGVKNIDEIQPNNMPFQEHLNLIDHGLTLGAMLSYNDIGGEVFGTCYDNAGNIYVTSTTLYGYTGSSFSNSSDYGYASIVKINGNNLTVEPSFMSNLKATAITNGFDNKIGSSIVNTSNNSGAFFPPALSSMNTYSGLGNICFDENRGHLLVTNFEDGKIWRITTSGVVIDAFDPFTADNGSAGFAPLGERIWGIQTFAKSSGETEVYFGVWSSDRRIENTINTPLNSSPGDNSVWKLVINASGSFGTPTLVSVIPDIAIDYVPSGGSLKSNVNQPVSDIAISKDGLKMFWSCRTMAADINQILISNSQGAHHSAFFYLERPNVVSTWSNPQEVRNGFVQRIGNSAGGVDFGPYQKVQDSDLGSICDQMIWTTGDYLHVNDASHPKYTTNERIYGIQGFNINEVFGITLIDHSKSYLIDADNQTIGSPGFDKTFMGDIEVFKCDCIDCQISSTINQIDTCCYSLDLNNITVSSNAAKIEVEVFNSWCVF